MNATKEALEDRYENFTCHYDTNLLRRVFVGKVPFGVDIWIGCGKFFQLHETIRLTDPLTKIEKFSRKNQYKIMELLQ